MVLHRLVHCLNHLGYPAYVVPLRESRRLPSAPLTTVALNTPELTRELFLQHQAQGLTPIAVYPEIVNGNPLKAPHVVRYYLNYPGLLGGAKIPSNSESNWSYSQKIADTTGSADKVLFFPVSDPRYFINTNAGRRSGTAYYAYKFKDFFGGHVGPEADGAFEITRHKPDSLSKRELVALFNRIELLYCYENSAIAIEAALCGCPVVLVPNEHFTESLGLAEVGSDGLAWGLDPAEIQRARATVHLFRQRYVGTINGIFKAVQVFAERTQAEFASASETHSQMEVDFLPSLVHLPAPAAAVVTAYRSLTRYPIKALHVLKAQGLRGLMKGLRRFLKR